MSEKLPTDYPKLREVANKAAQVALLENWMNKGKQAEVYGEYCSLHRGR